MRTFRHFVIGLIAALPASLAAQTISAQFAPNPAPPGAPITLTCTDAVGQGLQLPSPCTWYSIHQGAQTGPVVQLGVFCPAVIVPVPAHGTFSFTWDQRDAAGQLVPPGVYWFEVRAWDNSFQTLHQDWFCISIQSPPAPSLTAGGPARIGQNTPLSIAAPGAGGSIFVAAVSVSCNVPIVVPGLDICIGEPLFFAPLTQPAGLLDNNGNSSGLELIVPGVPIVLWRGLYVQALLLPPNGLAVTNALSFTVQP